MEKAVQSEKDSQQQSAAAAGPRRSAGRAPAPSSSRLGQLAASMNSSTRVQSLAQMKEDIDRSPRLQSLRQLAEPMQPAAPAQLEEKPSPNRTGLPDHLKSGVESLSGISLDNVKVHYNSDKPRQLNAHAYAQGTDIHVAPGQEKHLPHEAWHVTQQAQGRVRPTTQAKGVSINDDSGLEHEADVMGMKAATVQARKAVGAEIGHGEPAQLCGFASQSSLTPFSPSGVVVFQLHKGKDQYDETLDDMIIYKVVEKPDTVVYVGQTEESVGMDKRFDQHIGGDHKDWSKATHKIMKLEAENWTRFETDCAEQYWIDHYVNEGAALVNAKNQVSNSRFEAILEYQDDHGLTLYRGTAAKFPAGWHPAN